jgi:signal peptidase II
MRLQRLLPYAAISLFIILADQISKIILSSYLIEGESVSVIGNTVRFQFVYNEGGALGTSLGPGWIYVVLTIAAVILIGRYFLTSESGGILTRVPLALILGGAIGNLIDRVRFGRVIDFIDIDIPDIAFLGIKRWWTFNIADAAITCGLVIFLLGLLFGRKIAPVTAGPETESDRPGTEG